MPPMRQKAPHVPLLPMQVEQREHERQPIGRHRCVSLEDAEDVIDVVGVALEAVAAWHQPITQ